MLDTLLLRLSLHFTTLHYTSLHFTALQYTSVHFTTLHFTTLQCTSLTHLLYVYNEILSWYRRSTFKVDPIVRDSDVRETVIWDQMNHEHRNCAVCWSWNNSKYFTGLFRRRFLVQQFGRCVSQHQRGPVPVQRTAVRCQQQFVFRIERDVHCVRSGRGHVRQHEDRGREAVRQGVGMLSQMARVREVLQRAAANSPTTDQTLGLRSALLTVTASVTCCHGLPFPWPTLILCINP